MFLSSEKGHQWVLNSHMRAAMPGQALPWFWSASFPDSCLGISDDNRRLQGTQGHITLGWEMTAACCCWQDFSSLTAHAGAQHAFILNVTFLNLTKSVLRMQGKQPSYANMLLLSTAVCLGWESSDLQSWRCIFPSCLIFILFCCVFEIIPSGVIIFL